jgi:alkanesulfonate monooxygenase SsuD/methylene tetrahydromethanopterin reductase-like flavin-dependent oxidoreductase (luciferase family)
MQFGLFMMPLHPPERSFTESYDRDLAQIVLADRLGYHEVWIGEHLTERWGNAPAPELLIAQALLKTEKIILATGVTLLALHNPVEVAHRIAMLDHLAREHARQVLGRNYVRHQVSESLWLQSDGCNKIDPNMPDEAVDVDYMMQHMWIVGDPQEGADRIRQLYETVGGFGMLLAITQDSDNAEWDHRSLQLLMEEVGSRVADLGRS